MIYIGNLYLYNFRKLTTSIFMPLLHFITWKYVLWNDVKFSKYRTNMIISHMLEDDMILMIKFLHLPLVSYLHAYISPFQCLSFIHCLAWLETSWVKGEDNFFAKKGEDNCSEYMSVMQYIWLCWWLINFMISGDR